VEGAPNHPKTFGEELKRLRESAGLTIDDIAAETKISKRILTNLEEGEFRFLPQKVFSRNFVSQYATVVGADPYQLTEDFEAAWYRFLLASGAHPVASAEEAPFVSSVRWRFWVPVIIAVGILIAAILVIVRGSTSKQGMATQPMLATPVTLTPSPQARVRSPAAATLQDTPVALDEQVVTVVITVDPNMECWIHYRNRDGVAGGKLLTGGSVERFELAIPGKLTVGDASAVSLEVLGSTYRNLGRPGQVVHTEINADGLTVLGARARDE
jgi:transcriptional regulator with XRE-family HTH domain